MYRVKVEVKNGVLIVEADTPLELDDALAAVVRVLDQSPSGTSPTALPTRALVQEAKLSRKEPQFAEPPGPATGEQRLDYRGARITADFLYIALLDLGSTVGVRAFSPQEMYDHMLETGGDPGIRATQPVSTVRQALRNDERFVRDGAGYRAVAWLPEASGYGGSENRH